MSQRASWSMSPLQREGLQWSLRPSSLVENACRRLLASVTCKRDSVEATYASSVKVVPQ